DGVAAAEPRQRKRQHIPVVRRIDEHRALQSLSPCRDDTGARPAGCVHLRSSIVEYEIDMAFAAWRSIGFVNHLVESFSNCRGLEAVAVCLPVAGTDRFPAHNVISVHAAEELAVET